MSQRTGAAPHLVILSVLVGGLVWVALTSGGSVTKGATPAGSTIVRTEVQASSTDLVSLDQETAQTMARISQRIMEPGQELRGPANGDEVTTDWPRDLELQVIGLKSILPADQQDAAATVHFRSTATGASHDVTVEAGRAIVPGLLTNHEYAASLRVQSVGYEEAWTFTMPEGAKVAPEVVRFDFDRTREAENHAIAVLRSIAAAQQQLQASAAIDTNADGAGEYGFLAEMAGTAPIRTYELPQSPTGSARPVFLDPTYLPVSFGDLEETPAGGAHVRKGFAFQIHLPYHDPKTKCLKGITEPAEGAVQGTRPSSTECETYWCCYAWPAETFLPQGRAFLIHQGSDVYGTADRNAHPYRGLKSAPSFDAAFASPGHMGSQIALTRDGIMANDRNEWLPIGF